MPKHFSIILYVHGNQKLVRTDEPMEGNIPLIFLLQAVTTNPLLVSSTVLASGG